MTISITLQINWEQLSPKAAAIAWVATFSVESMEVAESESLELSEELCFFFFPPFWFLVFCFDVPKDFLSFFLVVVFPIAPPHATTGNNYQFSFFEHQTPVETHGLLLTLSLEPLASESLQWICESICSFLSPFHPWTLFLLFQMPTAYWGSMADGCNSAALNWWNCRTKRV